MLEEQVKVGTHWRGFSGRVVEVVELDGDSVRLEYVEDREDGEGQWWEAVYNFVKGFEPVAAPGLPNRNEKGN